MFCKAVTSGDEGDADRVGGRGGLADDVSINCGDGDLGCVADMILLLSGVDCCLSLLYSLG